MTFAISARERVSLIQAALAMTTLTISLVAAVTPAEAAAIREGLFNANTLVANDDGSTLPAVGIGFNVDFFGVVSDQIFVNNNGNVTFENPLSTFTPFNLTSTGQQIIAPFFADVDTRIGNEVTYGAGTIDGRNAFGVNWLNVGYFSQNIDRTNSFQLVLVDRSDTGVGNFDIEFNYDQIEWETGDASGGSNGLGGDSARVGFSNGTGNPETFFELPGSAVNGTFLNGGSNSLVGNSRNSNVLGRYVFAARNSTIDPGPDPEAIPTPALLPGLFGLGVTVLNKHRNKYEEAA